MRIHLVTESVAGPHEKEDRVLVWAIWAGTEQSGYENKSTFTCLPSVICCLHAFNEPPPDFQLIASPDAGDTCLSQKWMSSYSGIDTDNQPPVLWMHKEFNLCHISKNPIYLKTGSSFNCYWISFLAHIGTLTHTVRGAAVSDTLKHP